MAAVIVLLLLLATLDLWASMGGPPKVKAWCCIGWGGGKGLVAELKGLGSTLQDGRDAVNKK